MKLKAPQGVGDPCVAGVVLRERNGAYEVDPEVGALLIECFGFVVVDESIVANAKATPTRQRRPAPRKP